ncbi:hypothetical protein [Qipengyuania nanhaisediminis]|uniref:hypothetical protein n=1 Tax=Qipengyuania nanhaisediminis TaxID=604088 RepID=UPI0038B26FD6
MQNPAQSQFAAWPYTHVSSHLNGQRHVSDTSMSIEDMAFYQKRAAETDIRELIAQCRDRYCFAHELLKPHAVLPERLFDRDMLDIGPLLLPWSHFCSSYRNALFDPQMSLLDDQRARELQRWRLFVEQECFARFTKHPDWARAVLVAANLIPEREQDRDFFVGDLFADIIQDVTERTENGEDE